MTAAPARIAYLAVSADGYIADRFGGIGWLDGFGGAEELGFPTFLAHVDALVMGRRTFDQVLSFGGAWPYGSRPTIVLTRRPLSGAPASVRGAGEEEVTQALLSAPGRIWIVGGGETIAFCLRRGLLDEMHVFVTPIFLGDGVPLIGRLHKPVRPTLTSSEALPHGVVRMSYAIAPASAESAESAS